MLHFWQKSQRIHGLWSGKTCSASHPRKASHWPDAHGSRRQSVPDLRSSTGGQLGKKKHHGSDVRLIKVLGGPLNQSDIDTTDTTSLVHRRVFFFNPKRWTCDNESPVVQDATHISTNIYRSSRRTYDDLRPQKWHGSMASFWKCFSVKKMIKSTEMQWS